MHDSVTRAIGEPVDRVSIVGEFAAAVEQLSSDIDGMCQRLSPVVRNEPAIGPEGMTLAPGASSPIREVLHRLLAESHRLRDLRDRLEV